MRTTKAFKDLEGLGCEPEYTDQGHIRFEFNDQWGNSYQGLAIVCGSHVNRWEAHTALFNTERVRCYDTLDALLAEARDSGPAWPIEDDTDLENAITDYTVAGGPAQMSAAEVADFLIAVLTTLWHGEHLADPDQGDAIKIANRVTYDRHKAAAWLAQCLKDTFDQC